MGLLFDLGWAGKASLNKGHLGCRKVYGKKNSKKGEQYMQRPRKRIVFDVFEAPQHSQARSE